MLLSLTVDPEVPAMPARALVARFIAVAVAAVTLAACSSDDGGSDDDAGKGAAPGWPGLMLWTDVEGNTQPYTVVESSPGPEHCGWQSATFLGLNGGIATGGTQYLRDPRGIVPGRLATSFAANVELPSVARDTGFRREGWALWVTADAAYIVAADGIERWPRAVDGIGCA